MPKKQPERSRTVLIAAAVVLVVLAIVGALWQSHQTGPQKTPVQPAEKVVGPVKKQPVIDYSQLKSDKALGDMMDERKAAYGVNKGLDMIVKSDESVKIGEETVNMADIQRRIQTKEGGIRVRDLQASGDGHKDAFGIYVVQPGDNIWNIHFKLLKSYFAHKGVDMAPMADEPDNSGSSSGVGKLLKFSESMVYIYNVKEHALTADLNNIQPLSKIVVYKMDKVFELLEAIDYSKVNLIRFDGETIWITAQQ